MAVRDETESSKVSTAFRSRLASLKSQDKVRAIVLLQTEYSEPVETRARGNRKAIIDATRKSAGEALPDIDDVLGKFGGKRLDQGVSALGSILIEATPAGIKALAELEQVKAIFEDQPISSLPRIKQA
jgi:hypothetical protein